MRHSCDFAVGEDGEIQWSGFPDKNGVIVFFSVFILFDQCFLKAVRDTNWEWRLVVRMMVFERLGVSRSLRFTLPLHSPAPSNVSFFLSFATASSVLFFFYVCSQLFFSARDSA